MLKLLGLLTSLFTSFPSITRDIKEAYQAKLNAKNDQERIAADERIALLEARKTSVLASQSSLSERWIRIGFALPFVLYNAKLLIWDKMLEWGSTDPLSPALTQTYWIVLGGYFIIETIQGTARIIKK